MISEQLGVNYKLFMLRVHPTFAIGTPNRATKVSFVTGVSRCTGSLVLGYYCPWVTFVHGVSSARGQELSQGPDGGQSKESGNYGLVFVTEL